MTSYLEFCIECGARSHESGAARVPPTRAPYRYDGVDDGIVRRRPSRFTQPEHFPSLRTRSKPAHCFHPTQCACERCRLRFVRVGASRGGRWTAPRWRRAHPARGRRRRAPHPYCVVRAVSSRRQGPALRLRAPFASARASAPIETAAPVCARAGAPSETGTRSSLRARPRGRLTGTRGPRRLRYRLHAGHAPRLPAPARVRACPCPCPGAAATG